MAASQLTVGVTLLVLLAGVLHAVWNAVAKAITDKVVASGLLGLGCAVGAVVMLPFAGVPAAAAVPYLTASTLLHLVYLTALMESYRLGDFGHSYPIARGSAPLLVALGSWLFANQSLDGPQIAGVALIAGALTALVFMNGPLRRSDLPATVAALLTGLTIAAYTLMDGLGVRHSHNSAGYIAVLFVVQGPILFGFAVARRHRDPLWHQHALVVRGLVAGLLSLAAYGIVIWAQARSPFALVSALRETSVISGALIAAIVFRERFGWRRLPPAVVVAVGIVLVTI